MIKFKSLIKEDAATDIANVRKAMEAAIALLNNPKEIERRINNVKFAVYNSLDPNTNGGERPKPGFKFDDAWWIVQLVKLTVVSFLRCMVRLKLQLKEIVLVNHL